MGKNLVERCLACEAEGVATRGALPRLRRRGEQGDGTKNLAPISALCSASNTRAPPVSPRKLPKTDSESSSAKTHCDNRE